MTSARAHTTAAAVDGRRPALGQGTGRPVGSIHPLGGLSYPVLSCPVLSWLDGPPRPSLPPLPSRPSKRAALIG